MTTLVFMLGAGVAVLALALLPAPVSSYALEVVSRVVKGTASRLVYGKDEKGGGMDGQEGKEPER